MPKAPRSILYLATVLVCWAAIMPGWFVERGRYRQTSWALWGGHSCHEIDHGDECSFPSFGDGDGSGDGLKVGYVALVAVLVLVIGLLGAATGTQQMPWMKGAIMGGAAVGLVMSIAYVMQSPPRLQEDSALNNGPNAMLFVVGCVLAFATAAACKFDGTIDEAVPQLEPVNAPAEETG